MTEKKKSSVHCRSRFRILSGDLIALGPGKVDLLESIGREGSISQAARERHLSYRRAWNMVDTMNQCFKEPLVVSITGLDKFRTPKDIAASIAIILLAVICLANSSFRIRLGTFECTVLAAAAYVLVHSFFWGSLEAAVTVCLFALWLLLLPGLMSWEFQKRVWLIAGLCLSLNSVVNIFQYLGLFSWMLDKGGEVISGRLTPAAWSQNSSMHQSSRFSCSTQTATANGHHRMLST